MGFCERLQSIIDKRLIENIFQNLQKQYRGELAFKRRVNNNCNLVSDYLVPGYPAHSENLVVEDKVSFFDVNEISPKFEEEFGETGARLVATIVGKGFEVGNLELAKTIGCSVTTIE